MQKMTRATRRAADEERQTYHFSTLHRVIRNNLGIQTGWEHVASERAAWIAGPNGEPVFAMVPHSTPTKRMGALWSHGCLPDWWPATDTPRDCDRMARRDWRHRRAEERYHCRQARAKREVVS